MKKYAGFSAGAFVLFFVTMIIAFSSSAQKITKEFTPNSFTDAQFDSLKNLYGKYKTIPAPYQKQILIALSFFPELRPINIIFQVKHSYTPLSSKPTLASVVRGSRRRTYLITISDSTISLLTPILFKKLPFNAQIGVIGHEISHAFDFSQKSSFGLIRIGLGNLSERFLDRFEYRTDSICIAHGLGYQLLSWSIYVRNVLMNENWDGADNIRKMMTRERYMNPKTIRNRISSTAMYING